MAALHVRGQPGVSHVRGVLTALPAPGSSSISTAGPDASLLPPDLASMFAAHAEAAAFVMFLGPIGFLCPFAIGLWARRRRILEQPAGHRTLLRTVAAAGIGVAVLVALAEWMRRTGRRGPFETLTRRVTYSAVRTP